MRDGLRAGGLALTVLGWSVLAPRLPQRWNPLPQMAFGGALAVLSRRSLGLRPPRLWRGVRWGSAVAVPVAAAVAATTLLPPVRAGMAARELPASPARWLLLGIPLATVWSEEVAFRAALRTAAEQAWGPDAGNLFAATVFGLSHIPDARAAGDPVLGTVLVTGAAGWGLGWLHARSGSLAAPMIVHLVLNEAGAVAALAIQRRRCARARPARAARSAGRRSRS